MKLSEMIKNVLNELSCEIANGLEKIRNEVANDKELIKQAKERIDNSLNEIVDISKQASEFAYQMSEVMESAEDYHFDNDRYLANLNTLVNNEDFSKELSEEYYESGYNQGYLDCEEEHECEEDCEVPCDCEKEKCDCVKEKELPF